MPFILAEKISFFLKGQEAQIKVIYTGEKWNIGVRKLS